MSPATYGSWTAIVANEVDVVTAGAAAAMHGLFDTAGSPPGAGSPLPPLWHWMAFLPRAPQSAIGPDGHPLRGGFLPPVELPRRMFAGATLEFRAPLVVGEAIERRAVVTSVEEKLGRSGTLVFVRVHHELSGPDGVAVVEDQDIVYRGDGAGGAAGAGDGGDADEEILAWPWRAELASDPTLLFRFSALTYNAHRIHYDRAYATDVEGYPGLVVHGPLQAVALAELCRSRGAPLAAFSFRAQRPAFDGAALALRGLPSSGSVSLAALDAAGRPTVRGEARLATPGP